MKKILCTLLVLSSSLSAMASGIHYSPNSPTDGAISEARSKIETFVLAMNGVGSVGNSACEENTGVPFYKNPVDTDSKLYVRCITITMKTSESANALMTLFPAGTKVDGIFIYPYYQEQIHF